MLKMETLVKLQASNIQLFKVVKAFNGFTNISNEQEEDAPDNTLWVSEESVGGRGVRFWGNAPMANEYTYTDEVIFEMTKDRHGYDVRGYNCFWVREVEFISASSGSILKWVADEYPEGHKAIDGATGTFTWEQTIPNYYGSYFTAYWSAVQNTDEYTDPTAMSSSSARRQIEMAETAQ